MSASTSSLAGVLLDEPGVYDIAEADYHADPLRHLGGSASSSTLKAMMPPSCPALARHKATHPEFKDAYDLGSVTHGLTLGRGCEIREVMADSWSTGAAKAARLNARSEGAVALLSKDLAAARRMRDAVHAVPLAHAVLTAPGAPEQVLIWQEEVDGELVWCRAMLDRWPHPLAVNEAELGLLPVVGDLKKTAKGLDPDSLQRTIWSFGYHQQEEWYRRGYHAVHDIWPDFAFVFVSDAEPHLVAVRGCDDEMRQQARRANDEALRLWATCQRTGVWPDYGNDEIALIGPPRWATYREDS